jgi:hypothetical protein
LSKLFGMLAHGVIHTPNFHDRNDGALGRTLGYRQVSAHLAIAHGHSDVGVMNHDNKPHKENENTVKLSPDEQMRLTQSATATPQGTDP